MKSSKSYFLITGAIILSIFSGIFIWQNQLYKKIPKYNEQSFMDPPSSKYISQNADLVFHWKINPNMIPSYIGNYQDKVSRNVLNKKISLIRDSSFKLISLNFARDISKWVGDYGSFAVFDSDKESLYDWMMVLAIKDNIKAENEIESFLGSINIDKSEKIRNILDNSRKEIISKKINQNNEIYFANDKDKLLIASSPKIIESSLEKLEINLLNTRKKYKNIQLKDNLKDGFLLLEISPKKILNILGQEENSFDMNDIDSLISSINLDKNKLIFEGIIYYDKKIPVNNINNNLIDKKEEYPLAEDFIFIDNPKKYFSNIYIHPYQKLISSIITESTTSDSSNIIKIILENTYGKLIWINDKYWLAFTRKNDTNKTHISSILRRYKFLDSVLDFKNRNFEIWTKINTDESENYEIKENVGAIIEEDKETFTWGQNLSAFFDFDNKNNLSDYLYKEQKREEGDNFNDVIRIHLGKEKTMKFLNNFYPYILFKAMLGNKTNPPQNIDIIVAIPAINYTDFIKVKINLKTS